MQLPVFLEVYFWDVPVDAIQLDKHRKFIISRILNEGDHHAVSWVLATYSRETIKDAVKSTRGLSIKTARCWQNYFGLREDELCCTGLRLEKNERLY